MLVHSACGGHGGVTFLPPKISFDVLSCHRKGLGPATDVSRTRVLNVTLGTRVTRAMVVLVMLCGRKVYRTRVTDCKLTDSSTCVTFADTPSSVV